jgi:hypothetical protein
LGLGIKVHEQDPHVFHGQSSSEVDGSGRFSDPTLLIGNGNDLIHF